MRGQASTPPSEDVQRVAFFAAPLYTVHWRAIALRLGFSRAKAFSMRRHGFAAFVGVVSFLSACGGKVAPENGSTNGSPPSSSKPTDGSCPSDDTQYCPNDEPVTYDDIHDCNDQLADPTCGASYKAFLACAEQHITCNASGMTDGDAIDTACGDQLDQYEECDDRSPTHP